MYAIITINMLTREAEFGKHRAETKEALFAAFMGEINNEAGLSFSLDEEGFHDFCEWTSETDEYEHAIIKLP
jgi:hypothetical protein